MVEHHRGAGHRTRERDELLVLEVVVPRVVCEPAFTESAHTAQEIGILVLVDRAATRDGENLGVFGPREGITDSAEHAVRRCDVGVEHLVEVVECEVCMADECADRALRVACVLFRNEPGLADGGKVGRGIGVIGRPAFHVDRALDPVAVVHVGEKVLERVTEPRTRAPQVVVRVDDGAIRVDDVLDHEVEPLLRACCWFVHSCSLTTGR